jgi:hypothetical protein
MLRPSRTSLVILVCLLASGCRKLSPLESKLIGTWSVPQGRVAEDGTFTSTGATNSTTLNADHTFWQAPSKPGSQPSSVLSGTWHAEADQLALTFTRASPQYQDLVGEELRFIVSDFQTNTFLAINAQNEKAKLLWKRLR